MKITKEKLKKLIIEEYASMVNDDTRLENIEEPSPGTRNAPPVNPLDFKDAVEGHEQALVTHDGAIHFINAFLEKKFPGEFTPLRGKYGE